MLKELEIDYPNCWAAFPLSQLAAVWVHAPFSAGSWFPVYPLFVGGNCGTDQAVPAIH